MLRGNFFHSPPLRGGIPSEKAQEGRHVPITPPVYALACIYLVWKMNSFVAYLLYEWHCPEIQLSTAHSSSISSARSKKIKKNIFVPFLSTYIATCTMYMVLFTIQCTVYNVNVYLLVSNEWGAYYQVLFKDIRELSWFDSLSAFVLTYKSYWKKMPFMLKETFSIQLFRMRVLNQLRGAKCAIHNMYFQCIMMKYDSKEALHQEK